MSIDVHAARQFLHGSARVLEIHRAATRFDHAPASRVIDALRPYQNDDGGFGHGLEPDLRGPHSQVSATMSAFEVLAEIGTYDDTMLGRALDWLGTVTNDDGGVPHVLPTADGYPRAPWMVPSAASSFLTYPTAAHLLHLKIDHPWVSRASRWCWQQLEHDEQLPAYAMKFGLEFLDAVPDRDRAGAAVERMRPLLRPDGTRAVEGGIEGEHITPLQFSPVPGTPSRALFTDDLIETGLDHLEATQLDDGGWDFDFLHWSPGQAVEWRGLVTLEALTTLAANGRN